MMKKLKNLSFLFLAATAQPALASPQDANLATAGRDLNWNIQVAEKTASEQQLAALHNATLSIGEQISADLEKKISQRLRQSAELQ